MTPPPQPPTDADTVKALTIARELKLSWAELPTADYKYPWASIEEAAADARLLVAALDRIARALAAAEQERDEWKREAALRGLPRELMQRLHRAEHLVTRLRQWDHLDGAGDGPFWKREIDDVLGSIACDPPDVPYEVEIEQLRARVVELTQALERAGERRDALQGRPRQ